MEWAETQFEKHINIPVGAFNLHVFAVKETSYKTGKYEAYVGYYMPNGDFHFLTIPIESGALDNI